MPTERIAKRNGGELRGNSRNRRVRKLRMLNDPAFSGDGETCLCVHCHVVLTYDTVTADRIEPGGVYAYINIQASCLSCNIQRSDDKFWSPTTRTNGGVLSA